ncbi:MAG TPA: GNAT family N-acetyltransferase [Thermoanaerobaculia bacterium]|nr:GNAT family N-acetyltransferase [Thermoanaerobaculia bacterium]
MDLDGGDRFLVIDVVDPRSIDRAEYLAALNRSFPGWGGDAMFDWCYLRGNADLLVVRDRGRLLAGSGVVYRDVRADGETMRAGIICGAWTDPDARGRGLFSDLMESARALIGQRDAAMLIGFVRADNPSARALRSLGWTMVPARYLRVGAGSQPALGAAESRTLHLGDFARSSTHFVYTDDEWRAQFIDRPKPVRWVGSDGWRAIVEGNRLLDLAGDRERAIEQLGDLSAYSTTSEEWPGFETTAGFVAITGSTIPTEWDIRNGDRM